MALVLGPNATGLSTKKTFCHSSVVGIDGFLHLFYVSFSRTHPHILISYGVVNLCQTFFFQNISKAAPLTILQQSSQTFFFFFETHFAAHSNDRRMLSAYQNENSECRRRELKIRCKENFKLWRGGGLRSMNGMQPSIGVHTLLLLTTRHALQDDVIARCIQSPYKE